MIMETTNFSIKVTQTRRYGNKYAGFKTLNFSVVKNKKTGKEMTLWLPKLGVDTDALLLNNYKW